MCHDRVMIHVKSHKGQQQPDPLKKKKKLIELAGGYHCLCLSAWTYLHTPGSSDSKKERYHKRAIVVGLRISSKGQASRSNGLMW